MLEWCSFSHSLLRVVRFSLFSSGLRSISHLERCLCDDSASLNGSQKKVYEDIEWNILPKIWKSISYTHTHKRCANIYFVYFLQFSKSRKRNINESNQTICGNAIHWQKCHLCRISTAQEMSINDKNYVQLFNIFMSQAARPKRTHTNKVFFLKFVLLAMRMFK